MAFIVHVGIHMAERELLKEGEKILRALRLLTRGSEAGGPEDSGVQERDQGDERTTTDENAEIERSSVQQLSRPDRVEHHRSRD